MAGLYFILALLFSFTGIPLGFILSLIAPEEIIPGKKYLLFLKYLLFFGIFAAGNYSFLSKGDYLFGLIFSVIMLLSFLLAYIKTKFIELGNYLVFILLFLTETNKDIALILLSLIFLYGFPAGTLIRKIYSA